MDTAHPSANLVVEEDTSQYETCSDSQYYTCDEGDMDEDSPSVEGITT